MTKDVIILIAEDDIGHATLLKRNLERAGIANEMEHFLDGQEVLDYLFNNNSPATVTSGESYLLLLDIRMPRVDGIEVLRKIKESKTLSMIPVIMLTTTDDPREIDKCYEFGCNNYIVKPVVFDDFVRALNNLGLFLKVVEVPKIILEK